MCPMQAAIVVPRFFGIDTEVGGGFHEGGRALMRDDVVVGVRP